MRIRPSGRLETTKEQASGQSMVQAVMALQRLIHYGYCVSRSQIKGKPVLNGDMDGSLD